MKRTSATIDEAEDIDKSHSKATDESITLNSAVQMNASEAVEYQGKEVSSAQISLSTTSDVSASPKQKTKSVKSRPTCLLCNKSFHTRYKLNEHHAVVHLDKRLFSCNVCQKTFGRADHLIRHVRNRVCIPRQHQLLDLVNDPNLAGNCIVLYNVSNIF